MLWKTKQKNKIFEEIYSANYTRINLFIYKMCLDNNLAEELTQETFLRAFESLDKYKGESSIYTWLVAIAKYTYFSYMKKNKMMMDSIPLDGVLEHYCAGNCSSNEREFIKKEIYQAMKKLVYELPDRYKEVVLLRIYAELSFRDVAITLGISESSAKVLYFRAKTKLKESMENEFKL